MMKPDASSAVHASQGPGTAKVWLRRGLVGAFFIVVGYLLISHARTLDWAEIGQSLARRSPRYLALAGLAAAASLALYSCYDLLGRKLTGHRLATSRVMLINFVSYAFNLNLGAMVGGVAFRYRLYSKAGLTADITTRIVAMSMLTNWLGYTVVAGCAFLAWPPDLPAQWMIDAHALRYLGAVMLAVGAAWMLLCSRSRQRRIDIRGHVFELPTWPLALLQLSVSSANWLLIAAVNYFLLEQKVDFPTVLSVQLLAAIAGVLTHVPAGLGVLEAVFLILLTPQISNNEVVAALIAFRATYYLLPLAIALLLYFAMEATGRRKFR